MSNQQRPASPLPETLEEVKKLSGQTFTRYDFVDSVVLMVSIGNISEVTVFRSGEILAGNHHEK